MKIVLLMEGWTERVLPAFLKRWLDPQLPQPIGIKPVRFDGEGDYRRKAARRVELYLAGPDTLAVFGLLDLYGLKLDFPRYASRDDRIDFARRHLHQSVGNSHAKFRQHFAVYEIEAWLLSDPALFAGITLPEGCSRPEDVDFDELPSRLLARLTGRDRKVTRARNLLPRLDPNEVYRKCANFRVMMDDLLNFARAAG